MAYSITLMLLGGVLAALGFRLMAKNLRRPPLGVVIGGVSLVFVGLVLIATAFWSAGSVLEETGVQADLSVTPSSRFVATP